MVCEVWWLIFLGIVEIFVGGVVFNCLMIFVFI